jgi:RNA polymerase sigma factor (sigma-70 family)
VLGPQHRDVDDVTQEAIVGLLGALEGFRGECTVTQFARRVALLTALAARRRHRTVDRWIVADGLSDVAYGVPAALDDLPIAQIEAARRREVVLGILARMPPTLADAVVLYCVLGHTAEEIASMTAVPVNTVWSRIRLAKARLRRELSGDGRTGLGVDGAD